MDLHGLRILKFVESIFTSSKDSSRKHSNEQKQVTEKFKHGVSGSNNVENQNQHYINISKRSATNLNITEKNGKASIQSEPEKKNYLNEILNNFGLRRRRRRCNVREIRNKKEWSKDIAQSPQKFSKDRTSSDTRLSKDANRVEGNRKIDVTAPDQVSYSFKNNSHNLYSCKVEYENPFRKKISKTFPRDKSGSNCYQCRSIDESSSKTQCAYDNGMGHFNILNFPNTDSIANSSSTVKPCSTLSAHFAKNIEDLDEISISDVSVSVNTLHVNGKISKPTIAWAQVKALPQNQRKPKDHNCEIHSTHPRSQMGMIVCENSKFNHTNKQRTKNPFFAYFATKFFKNSRYELNKKEGARRKISIRKECLPKTTKLQESLPSPQMNNLDQTSNRRLGSPLIPHCNTKSTPSVDFSIWKPSKKCDRKVFSYDLPAKHSFEIVPRDATKKKCTTHRHNCPRCRNLKRTHKSPTERNPMNQYECYCAMFKQHPQNHNGDGNFCCPYEDCPKKDLKSNKLEDSPSETEAAVDSFPDSKPAKKRGQGKCRSLECEFITNNKDKPRQRCTCLSKIKKQHKSPPDQNITKSKHAPLGKGDKLPKGNNKDKQPCTCITKMMQGHQSPPQAQRQSKQVSTGKSEKTLNESTKSSPEMVVIHSPHEKIKNFSPREKTKSFSLREKTKSKKFNGSVTETSVKGVQCCPPKPILHNHRCQCKADHICVCFGEADENEDDDEGVGGGGGGGEGGRGGGRVGGRRGGQGRRVSVGGRRGGKGDTATDKKGSALAGKKAVTAPGKKGGALAGKKGVIAPGKKGAKPAGKKGVKPAGKKGVKPAGRKGAKPGGKNRAKPAGKKKPTATRKKGAKGPARKGAKATGKNRGKVKRKKEYLGKKGAKNRANELKKYKKGFGRFVQGAKKLHASKQCKYLRVIEGKVRAKLCPRKTTAQKAGRKCCNCLKAAGRLFCKRLTDYIEYRQKSKKRKTLLKRLTHYICYPLRKTKYAILAIFDLFNETNGYITKVDCDTLYIHALRHRPCFWIHRKWPKLYPYFLYYRKSFFRCVNILMILMAAFMWIPVVMSCYLFLSLLRACLCN